MQEMIEYVTKQVAKHLDLSDEQILLSFAKLVEFSESTCSESTEKTYVAMIVIDDSYSYNEYDNLKTATCKYSAKGKTYFEALINLANKF